MRAAPLYDLFCKYTYDLGRIPSFTFSKCLQFFVAIILKYFAAPRNWIDCIDLQLQAG